MTFTFPLFLPLNNAVLVSLASVASPQIWREKEAKPQQIFSPLDRSIEAGRGEEEEENPNSIAEGAEDKLHFHLLLPFSHAYARAKEETPI